ncbi:MAG: hypothetical protein N2504_04640 [candidate division WOR-3 bacterium]|nr:hypothetical protein [candidate division WOR-3 bacterium]
MIIILTKPLFSKILRGLAIFILILMVLNPKISYFEQKNDKIAVVFDLSRSSSWLIDFYKSIDTKNYDKFELGDSIYRFKGFRFKYNITNLNALSYLKNYDKIVYIGDGWHNYPSDINYDEFHVPIYVIYPNIKTNDIFIKNYIYPQTVQPLEIFQNYLEVFSNRDTTIKIEIKLDTIKLYRQWQIKKGQNSFTFILKAPNIEGFYKIELNFLNRKLFYPIQVQNFSKSILINAHIINPEIGILNRALKDMGYEVIVNLKNEKFKKDFLLKIGYGEDKGEDLVFLSKNKKFYKFRVNNLEFDSLVNFPIDEYIISPFSGISKMRVFVLTDELWKIGRYDFSEYKNIIIPIVNTAINLKPIVNLEYRIVYNKAYIKITSNNQKIKFFSNGKEIPNYLTINIKKEETLNIEGYLENRKVYEKEIFLKVDSLGFENEEGIDTITLSNLTNKTGGKFVKNLDEIESEKVRVQKEIFNNLFFGFVVIFLILLDLSLRRIYGYR